MSNYTNDAELVRSGAYIPHNQTAAMSFRKDERIYLALKRAIDIVGSLAGLLVCLIVFALIAVLIKWEDPKGSVFFRQVRVGKDGRLFHMYKFRSMVWNAEELLKDLLEKNEIQGAMFKMKDDPRITKVGRILRMTSLDELPQLWNVLKGEMSLVGPRPPLPREVEQYSSHDRQRLLVTPGCTGLWQVSGRNALSFEQMVELDLHYIQHRSIALDLKLILKTVKVMVFPNNAY